MGGPHAVERRAVLKILLHAIKYPSYTVNGVLLGSIKDGVVSVSDAVPLVHTFTTLVPTFETALFQVDAHCKTVPGLGVVGYYQVNSKPADAQLSGTGRNFASKVAALHPGSIALVLDGKGVERLLAPEAAGKPGSGAEAPLLRLFTREGRWSEPEPSSSLSLPSAGLQSELEQLSADEAHRKLTDFEDHLEDISRDWLNPSLLREAKP